MKTFSGVKGAFLFMAILGVLSAGAQTNGVRHVGEAGEISKAVVVDETVALAHTAQFLPFDKQGYIVGKGNATAKTRQVLANVQAGLQAGGSSLKDAVKLNVVVANTNITEEVRRSLAGAFRGQATPAVSFVEGGMMHPNALVAMDAVGVSSKLDGRYTAERLPGHPALAHVSVLPGEKKLYVSGQAKNGKLPQATRETLASLEETLKHYGLGKSNVIQLKAFMQPISEVPAVEEAIIEFFKGELTPPIVYVDWISGTNTPIEIELVASAGKIATRTNDTVTYSTPPGMTPTKVYTKIVQINHGHTIYISGLYGMKSKDGEGQIREMFAELKDIADKAGSDLLHLVKATYYVSDNEAGNKLNVIRPEFYKEGRAPGASKAKVKGVGVAGRTITMDMIAADKAGN